MNKTQNKLNPSGFYYLCIHFKIAAPIFDGLGPFGTKRYFDLETSCFHSFGTARLITFYVHKNQDIAC